MRTVRIPMLLTASVLFTACASAPGGERPVFGESVRHMIEAQTYTPGFAAHAGHEDDRGDGGVSAGCERSPGVRKGADGYRVTNRKIPVPPLAMAVVMVPMSPGRQFRTNEYY